MASRRARVWPAAVMLLSLPVLAHAQEPPPDAPAPADASPRVSFRLGVEWITAGRGVDPADTAVNPGNRVLEVPQLWLETEVRPNLRLEVGPRLQFVVRPHVRASSDHTWIDGRDRQDHGDLEADMTEAYVSWRPTDAVGFTYGLQNFQWGPAELLSPSNRVFHDVGIFRDPIYYVRGRHLVRVNVSAGRQWSLVGFAEVGANGEQAFQAGEHFEPKGQVKLEFTTASGASYVGVTAGARKGGRPWLGEYAMLSLTDAWSVYVDASHQRGSDAWFPVRQPTGAVAFDQALRDDERLRTLVVGGVRYTFVRSTDVRLEYLHQGAGWSEQQTAQAPVALALAPTRESFDRWVSPGLEFLGQDLALVSVMVPDLPPSKHVRVQGRYLRSFTDGSGVFFVTTSVEATASLVWFASLTATHGRGAETEFSRLAGSSLVVGVVKTW